MIIFAETMGEDLAKGLHVIWKHWQGHFDRSLKYYTKIGRIEDSEVQDEENLSCSIYGISGDQYLAGNLIVSRRGLLLMSGEG